MIKRITLLLTLGLVCLGLSAVSQTPAFHISPSTSTLDIGDTLEVEITVEDFTNVIGFSFSLNWDPNVLTYDNTVDTVLFQLPPAPSFGDNNASSGNLTFLWTRFPPIPTNLADGTTIISIVRFVATGPGSTNLDLNNMPTDDLVIVEPGLELEPILVDGSITVNGLPSGPAGFDCTPFTDFTAAVESDSAATGEVLCLTTFVCNWTEVVNAQWSYNWNPAILQFDSITNINPNVPLLTPSDFNANNNLGFGILAYADTTDTAGGSTIPDSTLFDVCFTVIGAGGEMDTVNISGSPLPIEVTTVNSMGTPITVATQEGFVTVSGMEAPAATVSASTITAQAEDLACVPVTVQNFTNLVAFQYTLEFDTSLLVYNSVQNFNPDVGGLAGSINDAPGFVDNGQLLTGWGAFPPVPVTLTNSDTLYEVCFDVKADAMAGETALITFSDDPVERMATQDNGSGDIPITLLSSDGEVDIIGSGTFEMTIEDLEVCPDSSICMPVIVEDGFNVIVSFQWVHTYDTNLFTYDGIENVHPDFVSFGFPEIAAFEVGTGNIRILWSDNSPTLEGKTLMSGDTLYSVCFTATGGDGTNSPIPFTDDLPAFPREVAVFDGPIPTIFNDGSLSISNGACPMNGAILVSESITDVDCNGNSTGAIDLTVTGGDGMNYTYVWDIVPDPGSTPNLTDLAAGNYSVTITSGMATFEATYTVNEPDELMGSFTVTDVACNGEMTGAIDLTVTGGTMDYSYEWNNMETTQDLAALAAGTYIVTITDMNMCTEVVGPIMVGQPDVLAAVLDSTDNVSCNGGSDGALYVTTSGGTTDYTFDWDNGADTEDISGLDPGMYSLTITDMNMCTQELGPFEITEPSSQTSISDTTITQVSCGDLTSGGIDITVTGGTPGYTYDWNNGAETEDLTDVQAGTYFVTITDTLNCENVFGPLVIGTIADVVVTATPTDASCSEVMDGSIDMTPTGGSGDYDFAWSNGPTTEDIMGLAPDDYTVTVTDSEGCSKIETFTVGAGAGISIGTPDVTDVLCNGESTGAILVTPTGGTGFTYEWSGGLMGDNPMGLAAADYDLTVTDDLGCFEVTTITVNEPMAISITETINNINCNGDNDGSIDIEVNGGVTDYTFAWSNAMSTQNIANLAPGTYTVTVTDDNMCQEISNTFTISQPDAIVINSTVQNETLGGDGEISLMVTGGMPIYTYTWDIVPDPGSTPNVTGLSAGTYNVTVTDNNMCDQPASFVINPVNAPSPVLQSSTAVTCFGENDGAILIMVNGGLEPYTYTWDIVPDPGNTPNPTGLSIGNYSVTVTDANMITGVLQDIPVAGPANQISYALDASTNPSCNGFSNGSIEITPLGGNGGPYTVAWDNGVGMVEDPAGIGAGTYTPTITDTEGCTFIGEAVVLGEPAALTIMLESINDPCFGDLDGSIDITPNGGTSDYTFAWSDGTTTTEDLVGAGPGDYTVTVTDMQGCSVTETYNIATPIELVVTGMATDESCANSEDGSVDITPSGGAGNYTFAWSDGVTTAEDLMGVGPNDYTVTVTDMQGCSVVETYTINAGTGVTIGTPDVTDAECNGENSGAILVTPTGGTGITYTWSDGLSGNNPTGLSAGNYDLTVEDDTGCTDETTITVGEPSAISITETIVDASCNGDDDGAISIEVAGGMADYTFAWSNTMSTQNISSLSAGTYTVTITDDNMCEVVSNTFTVSQPDAIVINSTIVNEINGGDGEIELMIDGGTPNYSYVWDIVPDPGNTSMVTGLDAGTYNVTVTDNNMCDQTASLVINAANVPAPVIQSVTPVTCFGGSDGEIVIMVNGGVGPYTYEWDIVPDPGSIPDPSGLSAGSYNVTVTDVNTAIGILQNIQVTQPANQISYTVDMLTEPSCNGFTDGVIQITPLGGNDASYTVAWDNGAGNVEDPTGIPAGTYTPTITDAEGCTFVGDPVVLTEPDELTVTLESAIDPSCAGDMDGEIHVDVDGGTAPYTYNWEHNGNPLTFNSPDITGLAPGVYCVTVTDDRGCTDVLCPIELDGTDAIIITIDSTKDVDCFSGSDGNIFITVTGGQPMYSYEWFNEGGMMFSNAEDLVGLIAGSYTPVITDANGCTATMSSPILISEPAQITVGITVENVSQLGGDGEILLNVNGGTPGYSYEWEGSNGNPLPGTNPLTGLNSGTYDVTITDDNGCTHVESDILVEGDIAIQAALTDPTCAGNNDGQICITPINAGGLVSYTWTTTDGSGIVDGAQCQMSLTAGEYFLTIEDSNGSVATDSFTLIDPPPIIVTNVNIVNESGSGCNGSINIAVTGGTGSYTYEWSNGATSQDITDLCKGQYSVIIKDENNCILVAGEYSVTAGPLLTGTITQEDVTCNGGSDGSISLNVLGGCPIYTFDLGVGPQINSEEGEATFSGLAAGNYALTVTDVANSTPIVYNFTIAEPAPIVVTLNQLNNNTDPSNCNGSINIDVVGGTGDYDYEWSTGQTSQDITMVCDGNGEISVLVTDSDGCTANLGGMFIELGLTASLQASNVSCLDEQDGSIETTVDGGIPPYVYTWSNSDADANIFGLEPGTYTVTITDNNGAGSSVVESVTINGPTTAINIDANVIQPVGSNANGSIELEVSGGWQGYSYSWTGPNGPIAGGALIAGLTSGSYTVIVTDANGCEESMTYNLAGGELTVEVNTSGAGSCIGDVGTAEANVVGGSGQYTYLWSNGFNTNIIGGLTAGVYTVTVTDGNGLTGTGAGQVASLANLAVELEVEDVTGSILALASGGNAPYTYVWNNETNDTEAEIVNQPSGDYAVVVTDADGCTAVAQGTITSGTCDKVRRVISPNGDNRNDEFIVACAQRFNVRIEIFNRWGQSVFTMDNYDNSWEGTNQAGEPLPEDGYFYVLEFTNSEGQAEQIKGSLTLLR